MRKPRFVFILTVMFFSLLFVAGPTATTQRRNSSNRKPPSPPSDQPGPKFDLEGTWVTSDGEEVEVTAPSPDGRGGNVFAVFTENNKLPLGACKFGDRRERFIDGELRGKQLTGTMWRCTESEDLFKGCHVPSVYTTKFKANVLSNDEIYGYRRSEWWGPGGSGDCHYTRDASGDRDIAFGLTRKKPSNDSKHEAKCADTKDLKLYKDVATRATKMINFVAHFARDEKIKGVLEQSSGTLEQISGGLEKIINAEEQCEKIAELVQDLKDFQEALDQINNAGCNTQKLAAGFDQLFRSAGKLGGRIDYFPALSPLFTILAQNQNFFTNVSGALNPEQRWASQFENVDGYIPNCPGG